MTCRVRQLWVNNSCTVEKPSPGVKYVCLIFHWTERLGPLSLLVILWHRYVWISLCSFGWKKKCVDLLRLLFAGIWAFSLWGRIRIGSYSSPFLANSTCHKVCSPGRLAAPLLAYTPGLHNAGILQMAQIGNKGVWVVWHQGKMLSNCIFFKSVF